MSSWKLLTIVSKVVYKLFRGLTTYLYIGVIIIKFSYFSPQRRCVSLDGLLWMFLVKRWGGNFPHFSRTAKREKIESLPKFSSTSKPYSRPQELGVVGTRNSNCLVVSTRLNCFCHTGSSSQVRLTIKLYQHRPQIAKTNFCVINVENRCNVCKKLMTKFIVVFCGVCVKLVALNIEGGYETGIGTLQWHPAIAPRPLPQGCPPPSTIAHYNGTLQWHPAMALRPLPQSTPQWHPAMALRPLLQSWSSPPPSPP